MEALIAAAIVAAWSAGRIRERSKVRRQLAEASRLVDEALEARKESRRAFDVQMDVIRTQRELLITFAQATERLYQCNDQDAWARLSWAAHRVNTESI